MAEEEKTKPPAADDDDDDDSSDAGFPDPTDPDEKEEAKTGAEQEEEALSEAMMQSMLEETTRLKDVGNASFKAGDNAAAIASYDEALAVAAGATTDAAKELLKPVLISLHNNSAAAWIKLEGHENAVTSAGRVLDLDAANSKALFRRGTSRAKLGQLSSSQSDLLAACKADPKDRNARTELASVQALLKTQRDASKNSFSAKFGAAAEKAVAREEAREAVRARLTLTLTLTLSLCLTRGRRRRARRCVWRQTQQTRRRASPLSFPLSSPSSLLSLSLLSLSPLPLLLCSLPLSSPSLLPPLSSPSLLSLSPLPLAARLAALTARAAAPPASGSCASRRRRSARRWRRRSCAASGARSASASSASTPSNVRRRGVRGCGASSATASRRPPPPPSRLRMRRLDQWRWDASQAPLRRRHRTRARPPLLKTATDATRRAERGRVPLHAGGCGCGRSERLGQRRPHCAAARLPGRRRWDERQGAPSAAAECYRVPSSATACYRVPSSAIECL